MVMDGLTETIKQEPSESSVFQILPDWDHAWPSGALSSSCTELPSAFPGNLISCHQAFEQAVTPTWLIPLHPSGLNIEERGWLYGQVTWTLEGPHTWFSIVAVLKY